MALNTTFSPKDVENAGGPRKQKEGWYLLRSINGQAQVSSPDKEEKAPLGFSMIKEEYVALKADGNPSTIKFTNWLLLPRHTEPSLLAQRGYTPEQAEIAAKQRDISTFVYDGFKKRVQAGMPKQFPWFPTAEDMPDEAARAIKTLEMKTAIFNFAEAVWQDYYKQNEEHEPPRSLLNNQTFYANVYYQKGSKFASVQWFQSTPPKKDGVLVPVNFPGSK